ncbi:hypothetical protein DPMN_077371 [Dreissena polymorpha]|uniref:Uncharacterized protein n=1 Tax=Dreissena polymorpha TaxID=45954 RepID=A0A9D3YPV2_DREPO|nr:hypothetical protein DPMN_077371 [Dreissena polymorpha]
MAYKRLLVFSMVSATVQKGNCNSVSSTWMIPLLQRMSDLMTPPRTFLLTANTGGWKIEALVTN